MSSVSNGLYFLTLQLVSVMRAIYRKMRRARYLYIKRNVEKVWGARYTLGARYLSKNTVVPLFLELPDPEDRGTTIFRNVQNYSPNYIGVCSFIITAVLTSHVGPYTNTAAHNPQCAGTTLPATRYHVACDGI